uniref:Uncharacterized protein n=1 Tax=Pseudomonas syringae pv. actinidiae TaxID=103796 RepID=A0A286JZZ6_PSESF|nr:hypothetical protein [Pseudomonas syringae pv. actinidiae]ARO44777.1 hypothetical protein [Pseudomonas syringae pv. actinidiae]
MAGSYIADLFGVLDGVTDSETRELGGRTAASEGVITLNPSKSALGH